MAEIQSIYTKGFKEPLLPTSNTSLNASDQTNEKIRQFVGSALEQTFPLGDGVANAMTPRGSKFLALKLSVSWQKKRLLLHKLPQ